MATASAAPSTGPGSPTTYDPPALLPRVVRRWWIILVVTLLAAAGAAVYSSRQTTEYRAEALVQVNFGAAALVVGPNQLPSSDDQRRVQTESALIASRRVKDGAEELMNGADLPDVDVVSSPSANDIVSIGVTGPDAGFAARAANAYVESYLTISGRTTTNQLQPARRAAQQSVNQDGFAITRLQRELVTFKSANGPGASAVRAQLTSVLDQQLTDQQTVDRLAQAASLGSLNARLFSKATAPTDPSSPSRARTVVVAGGLFLVLSMLVAAAVPLRRSKRSRA